MVDPDRMMCMLLLDLKSLEQPFDLLERYLFYLSRGTGPLKTHVAQKLLGGQDKSIVVIPEHFDRITFLITEDKNMLSLIWIKLELHTDHCGQA